MLFQNSLTETIGFSDVLNGNPAPESPITSHGSHFTLIVVAQSEARDDVSPKKPSS